MCLSRNRNHFPDSTTQFLHYPDAQVANPQQHGRIAAARVVPCISSVTWLITNPQSLILNPRSLVRSGANGLAAALLAPACAVCDDLLDQPLEGCVCSRCWSLVKPITPPVFAVCGDPMARRASNCAACEHTVRGIDRARAIGEYEGVLRELIHALKYDGRRSIGRPLASLMRSRAAELVEGADCVVPVPLHWRREYQRGFNQARELARYLGLPVVEALARRRHTRAQVELPADLRRANVADAFTLRRRWRRSGLQGMTIVLVDDVSTTGATLDACAAVLKAAGSSVVYGLTAARVVSRRPMAERKEEYGGAV